ncbi:hypothetical protein M0804_000795 [Polistes exclamans]|nr:hypothetical protein M0804_000795 [Polistes exclamans]
MIDNERRELDLRRKISRSSESTIPVNAFREQGPPPPASVRQLLLSKGLHLLKDLVQELGKHGWYSVLGAFAGIHTSIYEDDPREASAAEVTNTKYSRA